MLNSKTRFFHDLFSLAQKEKQKHSPPKAKQLSMFKKVVRFLSQLVPLDSPSRRCPAADGGQLQFAADLGEHAWHGRHGPWVEKPRTNDVRMFGMTRYNKKYPLVI